MKFEGIFIPILTPFDRRGEVDLDALRGLIGFWLEAGVSGLVVNASTGEGPLLSREEQRRLIEFVRGQVGGRARVIAGAGAIGTRETVEFMAQAKDCGAEAALVVTPYFFRPTDEELFQHYTRLLASVDLPAILYNVPKFTGYSIRARVVERIARECSNLAGVKDSSNDPGLAADLIRLVGDRVSVLSGSGDMILPILALGGSGAIIAVANVIPRTCVDLYGAFRRGDEAEAGRLQVRASYVNKVLVRDHSQIAALKEALNAMGRPAGVPRQPLLPLPAREAQEVAEALRGVELR